MLSKKSLYARMNLFVDLAVEAHDLLRGDTGREIPGVIMKKNEMDKIDITTVTITNKQGEQELGRPKGNYITIDAPEIKENNFLEHKKISETLSQTLQKVMSLREESSILIVGLGNWQATPDSLGPKVVRKIMVTRHLFNYTPEEMEGNMRKVAAVSPGVLGITGIETAEIIKGLVEHIRPDYVVAIDALAAGALERIGTTIQISDTGISPGSGIGNHRKGLNENTLGCRVIAIGVPTVVNAVVIAHKTVEELFSQMETEPALAAIYNEDNEEVLMGVLDRALAPFQDSLMVTPKEVDDLIDRTSKIIANALNICIHPAITRDNYETYQQ